MSDTPADTIVIRDRTPKALQRAAAIGSSARPARQPNQIRAMKALLVAMASDRVPTDIRVEETNRPIQLWNEARFSRVRQYEGRGLVGEKYLLQNISQARWCWPSRNSTAKQGGSRSASRSSTTTCARARAPASIVIRRGGEP